MTYRVLKEILEKVPDHHLDYDVSIAVQDGEILSGHDADIFAVLEESELSDVVDPGTLVIDLHIS